MSEACEGSEQSADGAPIRVCPNGANEEGGRGARRPRRSGRPSGRPHGALAGRPDHQDPRRHRRAGTADDAETDRRAGPWPRFCRRHLGQGQIGPDPACGRGLRRQSAARPPARGRCKSGHRADPPTPCPASVGQGRMPPSQRERRLVLPPRLPHLSERPSMAAVAPVIPDARPGGRTCNVDLRGILVVFPPIPAGRPCLVAAKNPGARLLPARSCPMAGQSGRRITRGSETPRRLQPHAWTRRAVADGGYAGRLVSPRKTGPMLRRRQEPGRRRGFLRHAPMGRARTFARIMKYRLCPEATPSSPAAPKPLDRRRHRDIGQMMQTKHLGHAVRQRPDGSHDAIRRIPEIQLLARKRW